MLVYSYVSCRPPPQTRRLDSKGTESRRQLNQPAPPLERKMKHLLLTTIAAVLVVGCGPSVDIWEAARTGNIEAVKQHIADGVDVNAPNTYGWTALYWASSRGHKEIVELLIANGAHVNPKGDLGDTPLDGAIEDNHTEIADILRKHGGKTSEEMKAEGK